MRRRVERCGGAAPAFAGNRARPGAAEGRMRRSHFRLGLGRLSSRLPGLGSSTDPVSWGFPARKVPLEFSGGPRRVLFGTASSVAAKSRMDRLGRYAHLLA